MKDWYSQRSRDFVLVTVDVDPAPLYSSLPQGRHYAVNRQGTEAICEEAVLRRKVRVSPEGRHWGLERDADTGEEKGSFYTLDRVTI